MKQNCVSRDAFVGIGKQLVKQGHLEPFFFLFELLFTTAAAGMPNHAGAFFLINPYYPGEIKIQVARFRIPLHYRGGGAR